MKQAGFPVDHIARKLGLSVEEVERRWKDIQTYSTLTVESGYASLCDVYTAICQQYNTLGETLKIFSMAISDTVSLDTLRALITDDKEETVQNLMRHCLILKPFSLPAAQDLIVAYEKQPEAE